MSASGRFASPLPVRLRFRVIAGMCAVTGECCLIRSLVDRLLGKEQALGSIPKLGSTARLCSSMAEFLTCNENTRVRFLPEALPEMVHKLRGWFLKVGWLGHHANYDAVVGNKQTPDGVTKPSQVSAERTNRLVLHCRCCWRGLAPVSYSGFCQFDSDQRLVGHTDFWRVHRHNEICTARNFLGKPDVA